MKIIWSSILTDVQLFREERATNFATWSHLPDFDRLASISVWRDYGERADAIYSAERFELYRRFQLDISEWSQKCGMIDLPGLMEYRMRRKMALATSRRSAVIDGRSEREALKIVQSIAAQLTEAGVTGAAAGSSRVTDDFAFSVGNVSVEQRVICISSGLRIQLYPSLVPAPASPGETVVSHGLVYIDAYGVLTNQEIAAVRAVVHQGSQRFRKLLSE